MTIRGSVSVYASKFVGKTRFANVTNEWLYDFTVDYVYPSNVRGLIPCSIKIANTVRCLYNTVNSLHCHYNRQPLARSWGQGMVACCAFKVWSTFCHCHRSAVSWKIAPRYTGTRHKAVSATYIRCNDQHPTRNVLNISVINRWQFFEATSLMDIFTCVRIVANKNLAFFSQQYTNQRKW